MKALRILSVLSFLIGLMLLVSCEYEFIEVAPPPPPPEPGDTTSFAQEVAPIFESDGCTACHDGGLSFDLTALNAYYSIKTNELVVPFNPEGSIIYTYPHPQTGEHHSKYKSNSHSNTIYNWIMQGALDN